MNFVKPNQLDMQNPGVWPIYYQAILWILIAIGMLFLYQNFVREDLLIKQNSNQAEISTLEGEYADLYQNSLDLPLYRAQKNQLGKELVALLEFLPAETEMASLIEEVYNAAYRSNINFNQFAPKDRVTKEYYDVEPIFLETSTGFNNFVSYVEYIGRLKRIMNVRRFELHMDQRTQDSLNITSNLETYIYNQDITKYIDTSVEGGNNE